MVINKEIKGYNIFRMQKKECFKHGTKLKNTPNKIQ